MTGQALSYEAFLASYVSWCKAAIRSAALESFTTLRNLGDPFTAFVFSFLSSRGDLEPGDFFESSLARLLRLNAALPEEAAALLHEAPASFWAELEAAARADLEASRERPVEVGRLSRGHKPGVQVVRNVDQRLRSAGLNPERPDSRTVTLFSEIDALSIGHFFDFDERGFCFWSALRFPGDRTPRFITSYAGSLGLAVRTRVDLRGSDRIEFATLLALEWRESFDRFVQSWTESHGAEGGRRRVRPSPGLRSPSPR